METEQRNSELQHEQGIKNNGEFDIKSIEKVSEICEIIEYSVNYMTDNKYTGVGIPIGDFTTPIEVNEKSVHISISNKGLIAFINKKNKSNIESIVVSNFSIVVEYKPNDKIKDNFEFVLLHINSKLYAFFYIAVNNKLKGMYIVDIESKKTYFIDGEFTGKMNNKLKYISIFGNYDYHQNKFKKTLRNTLTL